MAIYGSSGNDTLTGTAGGDDIYGYPQGADPDAETGADSISGGAGHDRLYGGGGNDTLRGGDGFDIMVGGAGDDVLQDGGTGLDSFDGGAGDDLFLISGSGNDVFQGGAGQDTLRLEGDATWSRLILDAAAAVETLDLGAGVIRGTSRNDIFDLSGLQVVDYRGRAIEMGAGENRFTGHTGADHVLTQGGYAVFDGGAGADTLRAEGSLVNFNGGAGDDLLLLSGHGWNDTILGGAGADTVRLDGAAERHNLIFDAASGIETLDRAGFALTGTRYSDIFDFSGLSRLANTGPRIDMGNGHDLYTGWSGRDVVSGGFGEDTLIGGGGADHLDGGASADVMRGGAGNDRYIVDNARDLVDETGGNGVDTVASSVSFSLAQSATTKGMLENLVLTGSGAIDGAGNVLDNVITGNAASNILRGGAGGDTLKGGGGDDRLDGGVGFDLMIGGKGNDVYVIDGDTYGFENMLDRVVERAGEGTDLVLSYNNVRLTANVENLILMGTAIQGLGNGLANRMTGNDGDNQLSGAGGGDRLDGRGGRDVLSGGDGADSLTGGAGRDSLTGGAGGAGGDRLAGGTGQDRLTGGAGADRFVFAETPNGNNLDHIVDFSAGGGDRIQLEADIFAGLGMGRLDDADFREGTAAAGTGAQILYHRDSGRLWYDSDGAGGSGRKLIAVLDNHARLDADDIFLI